MAEYLWYKNNVAVNYQNGGSGVYTVNSGNTSGTDIYELEVAYTGDLCLSATSATASVVKSIPVATITPSGPTTFCASTPTTLNANAGMTSYAWKRSTTPVGTNSDSYIPMTSGNHAVTVTDANGCSKTSAWTSITVRAIPTANAGVDKNVCDGASAQIGAANNIANTYTWSPTTDLSNPYISNPVSTPLANTSYTYTVTVMNTATGCSNTDAMSLTSLTLPATPTVSSMPSGNNYVLTPNAPGATSVNWYKNGLGLYANRVPNASITVPASNPTFAYTARAKGANGCLSLASSAINVRLSALDNEAFSAYPNPTSGLLKVEIAHSELNMGKLFLYNHLGQVVMEKEVNLFAGKANLELDMSQLAAGIYHLSFGEYTQKVIKE